MPPLETMASMMVVVEGGGNVLPQFSDSVQFGAIGSVRTYFAFRHKRNANKALLDKHFLVVPQKISDSGENPLIPK